MPHQIDKPLAGEYRRHGAGGQERPERQGRLAACLADGHRDQADHGAEQETPEQADGHDARVEVSQVQAQQRGQAYVAVLSQGRFTYFSTCDLPRGVEEILQRCNGQVTVT